MNKQDSVFDLPCECNLCEPDMAFQCAGCLAEAHLRRVEAPYCQGNGDRYFDYCTPCFWQLSENLVTVVIQVRKPNVYINSKEKK